MNSGTKRGQFQRQSSGLLACVSPSYLLIFIAAVLCLIGYHCWSQSSRMDRCRVEVKHYRAMLQEATQQKMILDGRLSELHTMMDKKVRQLTKAQDLGQSKRSDEEKKEKRVLALESELVEVKEKLERCSNMAFRAQSRIEEESNSKTSTVIRNKTQCEVEINRQYDEIDKWIKSMVDDRTYSQFQMKFGKDRNRRAFLRSRGEKTEADKLQRLEKIVMQRDEIKAAKDEKVKEEIRAREAKMEAQQKAQRGRQPDKQEEKKNDKHKWELEPKVSEARAASVHRELAGKDAAGKEHGERGSHSIHKEADRHPEIAKGIVDTRFMEPEPKKGGKEEGKEELEPKGLKKSPSALKAKIPVARVEHQKRGVSFLEPRSGRLPVRAPVRMMQKE